MGELTNQSGGQGPDDQSGERRTGLYGNTAWSKCTAWHRVGIILEVGNNFPILSVYVEHKDDEDDRG